jgi:hypothetical protein
VQFPTNPVGRKGVVAADATPGAVTPMQSTIATITPTRFISDFFNFAIFHMLKHYVNHVLIVQGEKFISRFFSSRQHSDENISLHFHNVP